MRVEKCIEGGIFKVTNPFPNGTANHHRYLVIGTKNSYGISMVQAFAITSMSNKDVTMEVPIVLDNGYVSYVVPYNIHSLHWKDIRFQDYVGSITDTSTCKRDDFLRLLKDIYLDSIGEGNIDHEELVKRYTEYRDTFFKKYADVKEWRNREKEDDAPRRQYPNMGTDRCPGPHNNRGYRNGRNYRNNNDPSRFGESHLSHSRRFCDDEQREYHRNYQGNY